jgi:hypothetical protein
LRLCDDRLYGNRTLSRPFVSLFPALPLYRFTRPLCHQSTELNPPSSFVDHDMRLFLCPNYTPVVERASRTVYWPPSSSIHPIQSRRAIPTLPANYGGGGRANRESKKPRSCGSAAEAKPIRAKREKKRVNARSGFRPGLAHIEQSACMTRIRLMAFQRAACGGNKAFSWHLAAGSTVASRVISFTTCTLDNRQQPGHRIDRCYVCVCVCGKTLG